jgi:hypothetical protein
MSRSCTHHRAERCTNALALPVYGAEPSPGICAQCEHYEGPARGLGDRVAAVTRATGIAAATRVVSRVTGKPCGCAQRRARLNAAFPTSYPQAESPKPSKVDEPPEPI